MRLLVNFLEQLLSISGNKDAIGLEDFEAAYELFSFKPVLDGLPLQPFSGSFLNAPKAKVLDSVSQEVLKQAQEERKRPGRKTGGKRK